ncbi:hypothetical protein NXY33_22560 [Bacteroides fragilis]|nr:hypothetical protein [Bacteroides fragilis]
MGRKGRSMETELSCAHDLDWTDGHTGKTVKLNRHDMAEMQTITAECLNMERGVSSDKKHLSAMQYKNKMETEKAEQLQKTSSN